MKQSKWMMMRVVVLLAGGGLANGAEITWTGADAGNNWSAVGNWSDSVNGVLAGDHVTFTNAGASATIGEVNNVVDASLAIGRLEFRNNGVNYHTMEIPAGKTLTVNGSGDYILAGDRSTNTTVTMTRVDFKGGGALVLNHPGDRVQISCRGTATDRRATLDMSALGSFNATVNHLHLAHLDSGAQRATFYLATNSTITATGELGVGGYFQDAQALAELHLGASTALNVATLYVGRGRSTIAKMQMQGDGSGATVTIRGAAGGDSRAQLDVGRTGHWSTSATGEIDFEQATVDARFGTVLLGEGCGSNGSAPGTGTLRLGNGLVDATNLLVGVARHNGGVNYTVGPGYGYVHINGGILRAETITLGQRFTSVEPASNNRGYLYLAGGTLEAATIQAGVGELAERRIYFSSGTLRPMAGTNLVISGLHLFEVSGAAASCVMEVAGGYTNTIASALSGTGGFTKTGAGELVLAANAALDDRIIVSNGTLTLNATLAHTDIRIETGATLAGTGILTFNINAATADPGVVVNGGTLDLSALSLAFAGTAPTLESYVVATNAGGTLTGAFATTNSLPGGYELVQDVNGLRLERKLLVETGITIIEEDTYPTGNTLTIAWTTDQDVAGWLAYRLAGSSDDYSLSVATPEGLTHTVAITGLTELTDYDVVIWSSASSKAYPMKTLIADPTMGNTSWTGVAAGVDGDRRWDRGGNWDVGQPPWTASISTFTNTGSTNVIGAVNNIVETDRTIARLEFRNNGVNYHTMEIPAGNTLTVNGSGDYILAGDRSVNTSASLTRVDFKGGGSLVLNHPGNRVQIDCIGSSSDKRATLDMSALGSFSATVAHLHLAHGNGSIRRATVYLATNSTITATGELGVGGWFGDAQSLAELHLGASTVMNVATMYVGRGRSTVAKMEMQGDGADATVTIRGAAGGDSRAALDAGVTQWNSTAATGSLDFENSTVDAMLGTVRLGEGCLSPGTARGYGYLAINRGTLDVTNFVLGKTSSGPGTGQLTIGADATVTAGAITLADGAGSEGVINLNGGTLNITSALTTHDSGTGTITVNVGDTSCGLDLVEDAAVTITVGGKIQINITAMPVARDSEGHYGLRWVGNQQGKLQDLKDTGKLDWDGGDVPGKIAIYWIRGVTYVGIPPPPPGTIFSVRYGFIRPSYAVESLSDLAAPAVRNEIIGRGDVDGDRDAFRCGLGVGHPVDQVAGHDSAC